MIHSHLEKPYSIDRLRMAKKVSNWIDKGLKDHGIDKLYTWAITKEQDKYNKFLGFHPTEREITINGLRTNPSTFEYVKEL